VEATKKKALILTSNKPRHRWFAHEVSKVFQAPFVLMQKKRKYYQEQKNQSKISQDHFARLEITELIWFPPLSDHSLPPLQEVEDINSSKVFQRVLEEKFEVICLFGTEILAESWLSAFPAKIVNLHLGLSPFYRGAATLFWPFVNEELHYLGSTIHLATAQVDAGDILDRIDPLLKEGEDYYNITFRLIQDSIAKYPSVVSEYLEGKRKAFAQESFVSRNYRKKDFNDVALTKALEYVGTGLSYDKIQGIKNLRKCRY